MFMKFYFNYRYFLLASVLLFIHACDSHNCNTSLFTGITARDYNGNLLSGPDPDDWNFDEDWGKSVSNLFDSNFDTDCNPPYPYAIFAYPNPCDGTFALTFDKDSVTSVELRLVNFVCGTLVTLDDITERNIFIQPENNDQKGIVRLYYKFVRDGCEFRGHGDISIE